MKKLLIVVDMQRDFLTGALANEAAVAAIPAVIEEIGKADYVVFTRDTHGPDYMSTLEGRNLPIPHCIEDTPGWEVEPSLVAAAEDAGIPYCYVDKPTFGYEWGDFQLPDDVGEVEFVGTCTDICVISNICAFRAAYPQIPQSLRADACAGVSEATHQATLAILPSLQVAVL